MTLLECPGEVVTRENLCARVWGDGTFVDFEHGLNAAVNKLRRALGDSAEDPRFIETVPGRGYRFIAAFTRAPEMLDPGVQPEEAPPVSGASPRGANTTVWWLSARPNAGSAC